MAPFVIKFEQASQTSHEAARIFYRTDVSYGISN